MPTYEYKCKECGHEFEVFQKINASPVTKCYECGGSVERLIALGSGFILRGGALHKREYRHDGASTHCGRDVPCCGRQTPCNVRPCEE